MNKLGIFCTAILFCGSAMADAIGNRPVYAELRLSKSLVADQTDASATLSGFDVRLDEVEDDSYGLGASVGIVADHLYLGAGVDYLFHDYTATGLTINGVPFALDYNADGTTLMGGIEGGFYGRVVRAGPIAGLYNTSVDVDVGPIPVGGGNLSVSHSEDTSGYYWGAQVSFDGGLEAFSPGIGVRYIRFDHDEGDLFGAVPDEYVEVLLLMAF